MIDWRVDYRLGIPEIDGQHLVLCALINQIEINMDAQTAEECLEDVVSAVMSYTRFHFESEERIMKDARYGGLAEHRNEHLALIEEVRRIRNKMREGAYKATEFQAFLLDWLINHIYESDARFAIFIRQRRQGLA